MKKMFYVLFAFLLAFGLAAGAVSQVSAADTLCVNVGGTAGCYSSIQAAINAAADGDTITVANGYYPEFLQIYKPITLKGSGTGTIINASASSSYGMDVYGDGVTLQDFTFIGPSYLDGDDDRYGIKVTGDPAKAPSKGQNFTIQNVLIQSSGRTGLDLHGLDVVIVSNVTSNDNHGAGIALTDVDNAILNNINTSGNTWGQGVVINTTGAYYDGGSDGITITNLTSTETYPVMVVMAGGYLATNLEVPQYPFMVMNNTYAPGVIVFRPTLSAALVDALAAPNKADSVIKNSSEDTVYVAPGMSIQTAINAADPGDTVNLAAGTYNEALQIYKSLTLSGAGISATIINAEVASTYGLEVYGQNVTLDGFTFTRTTKAGTYGIKVTGNPGPPATKGSNFNIHDVAITNWAGSGLDLNGLNGVNINNVTSTGNGKNGVALTDVDNATIDHVTTSGNAWSGVAVYTKGAAFPGGSDHVSITNLTAAEPTPVYVQMESGYQVTNLDIPQYPFTIVNSVSRPGYIFFQNNLTNAMAVAAALPNPSTSVVRDSSSNTIYVSPGMSIQVAVNTAVIGDIIEVAAGTYTEQVFINKSLTLVGEDRDTTIIKAPATIPNTGSPDSTIIKIYGTGVDVGLTGFTLSGPKPASSGNFSYGIVVRDGAHANIHDNKVLDIRDDPFSGGQYGIGILIGRNAWSTTGSADITDNLFERFQKGAIVVDNTGSTASISGNTITGAGFTTVTAQNGIQVSRGANATINNNTISNISYTPDGWSAAGILLYVAGDVTVTENTLTNTQDAIDSYLTSKATISENIIHSTSAGLGSPAAGAWGIAITGGTVTASGNSITNDGTLGGLGISVGAGYNDSNFPLHNNINTDVTLNDNTVSGWNTGVSFDQCETSCGTGVFTGIEFEFNQITGNTTQVENLNVVPAVPASPNWWGSAADPGFNLDEVSYSPWCADLNCTTFRYLANDIQNGLDATLPGGTFTLEPGIYIIPNGLVLGVNDVTVDLKDGVEIRPVAGPCFQVNANGVTIKAGTPGGAKCVPPTFFDGLDLLKAVNGLRVVNMEFDGSAVNTLDGLNLGFGLTNFQFLNNYIHDFDRDGVRFTPSSTPAGTMVLMGNLFAKNSGFGVNNLTPVSLTTTYNGWNDVKGPTGTYGDGVGGKQTYKPFTNADLLMTTSGTKYAGKLTAGETLTVAVKVNAANLFGAQFNLIFDPTKLNLISITDSNKLAHDDKCKIGTLLLSPESEQISYCGKGKLLNGTVTLYTLKFGVVNPKESTTILDFVDGSALFASNSTGASNYVFPGSLSDVTINTYDSKNTSSTFNVGAQILLQGVNDNHGICVNLSDPITLSTKYTKCATDKWGNLTLDNLPVGSYLISTSGNAGYIDLPTILKKTLVVNPGKTKMPPLTLMAGNVDNTDSKNVINLSDVVKVAYNFGNPSFDPITDINRDGKVDLLDLAIVALNYNKTYTAYNSWKP